MNATIAWRLVAVTMAVCFTAANGVRSVGAGIGDELDDPIRTHPSRWTTLDPLPLAVFDVGLSDADGWLVVTGGFTADLVATPVIQVRDPSRGWRPIGTRLHEPRARHAQIALDDGRILVVGGVGGSLPSGDEELRPLASAEVFDPKIAGTTVIGLAEPAATQTLHRLPDGRIAVVGGRGVRIFDPQSNSFTHWIRLRRERTGHAAALVDLNRFDAYRLDVGAEVAVDPGVQAVARLPLAVDEPSQPMPEQPQPDDPLVLLNGALLVEVVSIGGGLPDAGWAQRGVAPAGGAQGNDVKTQAVSRSDGAPQTSSRQTIRGRTEVGLSQGEGGVAGLLVIGGDAEGTIELVDFERGVSRLWPMRLPHQLADAAAVCINDRVLLVGGIDPATGASGNRTWWIDADGTITDGPSLTLDGGAAGVWAFTDHRGRIFLLGGERRQPGRVEALEAGRIMLGDRRAFLALNPPPGEQLVRRGWTQIGPYEVAVAGGYRFVSRAESPHSGLPPGPRVSAEVQVLRIAPLPGGD